MKNLKIHYIILFCLSTTVYCQDPKPIHIAFRAKESPIIDGALNDEVWKQNNWEGELIQYFPYENCLPSEPTEFKICFDDVNLYVAIKAYDSSPDSIVNHFGRRDNVEGDMTFIMLDSYHDLRTGFLFGVNSAGVRYDMIISDDGRSENISWDPIWQVITKIHDWGWVAEMKIPFTQLRFQKNSDEVWGLIVSRQIYRYGELSHWPAIPRDASGIVHMAGELGGLAEVEPRKQLDIMPYGVAAYNTYEAEEGNPFMTGSEPFFKAGIDTKIGITNNLILDLTILPDFGQVEADPSQVNLTAFETFFEEKRPFFIEGKSITSFNLGIGDSDSGNDNLFYSRRIGRKPHGYPFLENKEYADIPLFTNILGAAKLTGKTKSGMSVGIIESLTSEVKAKIDSAGKRSANIVEPLTNYSLARVQKDFNKGNTIIGGAITSTIRSLNNTGMDYLHKNATTAGFDFTQYFKERNYVFNTSLFMSNVRGSEGAITRTQMLSARYYQRPDADYIELDETSTSLTGFGGKIEAGKIAGKWDFAFLSNWKSPGLELNDMGYQKIADIWSNCVWTGYNSTKPISVFRLLQLSNYFFSIHDFGGNLKKIGYEWNGSARFNNYWDLKAVGDLGVFNESNNFLRGGPAMILPYDWRFSTILSTDSRKKVIFSASTLMKGVGENVSFNISYNFSLTFKPNNSIKLSLNPIFTTRSDKLQYVTKTSYNNEDRYIFGTINQKLLSMSLRVDYTITPDLTIQYWGQPFIATGSYSNFKMITNPKADELSDRYSEFKNEQINLDNGYYSIDENSDNNTDYGFGNPDFNIDEWKSNLVIRWEFLPGSIAYLVWSQSRDFYAPSGEFDISNNLHDLFTHKNAFNTFLLKLSYRIGLR